VAGRAGATAGGPGHLSGRWRWTARRAGAPWHRTGPGSTCSPSSSTAPASPSARSKHPPKDSRSPRSQRFETAAFATVLDRLDLTDVVVTADALHTQRTHAAYLHRHHGRYAFIVKGNQPTLHAQMRDLPWAHVPIVHDELVKGHGRREHRTLQVVSVAAGIGFPHARLAARVTRTRGHTRTGKTSRQAIYAVTSLGWDDTNATGLAHLIRGHWAIEVQRPPRPRHHLRRRRLPGPHRHRPPAHGHPAQHRHRPDPHPRPRPQHRRRDPNAGSTQQPTPRPPGQHSRHIRHRSIDFELTLPRRLVVDPDRAGLAALWVSRWVFLHGNNCAATQCWRGSHHLGVVSLLDDGVLPVVGGGVATVMGCRGVSAR